MTAPSTSRKKSKSSAIPIYGLTGGIASGKSTVAEFLRSHGVSVFDADEIARSLRAPRGAAYRKILDRFGTTDSSTLKRMIFTDPKAKADLEAIMHPLIQKESRKLFSKVKDATFVVYEASLLVETGGHEGLSGLIVVVSNPDVRIRRIMARDGVDRALAQRILDAQSSDQDKLTRATHIVENNGTRAELELQINALVQLLTGERSKKAPL